ncbi:MAG TPA: efflux transporter outer membrane subunit [Pirellulales bacterium]
MSTRVALAALALVLLAGSGCTSMRDYVKNGFKVGPNYARPPAPVADDWIDSDDMRLRKEESPDLARWWALFNDPVLNELVADAYRQNITLREAGFRIIQNRALLGIAVGGFFPQQQYAFGDHTRNAISTQAANRAFVLDQFFPQWDAGFTLNWELDFWGRFRRAITSANDRLDASVEDFDATLVTLFGDLAQAYVQIRITEQQIALTKANIDLQRETLALATARFRGGLVTELDVDQAQSILSQTEAQIPQLEIVLRQTTNRMCVLLGIPAEDLERRMVAQPIPTVAPEVAVGIPADLIRRRPDVRRAERNAAAQAEQIGIAESDFYPALSLNGTFSYSAQQFSQMFNQSALYGSWGPAFQWNLLNYGRILNNVRAQDAIFQELVAHYQNTVLSASRETEDGIVTFLKSQQQTRFMAESVRAAKKAVVIAIAQYRGGLVDFNRVSLVEQNLVQQQNLYAQAYGNIALGLVATYRALGGGWQIRLDPAAAAAPGLPPPDPNQKGEHVPAAMPLLEPPVAPSPQQPLPIPGRPPMPAAPLPPAVPPAEPVNPPAAAAAVPVGALRLNPRQNANTPPMPAQPVTPSVSQPATRLPFATSADGQILSSVSPALPVVPLHQPPAPILQSAWFGANGAAGN